MLLPIALAGCFRNPSAVRPPRPINYWEALAELHPADAVAAARTPSETEFAEALGDLMAGNIEKAEARFRELRKSAADSVIRAGSRVVYTATLQYQEKWQVLSALKSESTTRSRWVKLLVCSPGGSTIGTGNKPAPVRLAANAE